MRSIYSTDFVLIPEKNTLVTIYLPKLLYNDAFNKFSGYIKTKKPKNQSVAP